MPRGRAGTGPSRHRSRRRPGTGCRPEWRTSRRQQRGPLPVQPACRGPQQARDPQHEAQRQDARGGQAPDAVRQRADRRVDDRRPGEVRREIGDRGSVQPPRPFQVPGPQVQGLVLEGGVGPDEPQRQGRLYGQDGQPAASRRSATLASAGRAWPSGRPTCGPARPRTTVRSARRAASGPACELHCQPARSGSAADQPSPAVRPVMAPGRAQRSQGRVAAQLHGPVARPELRRLRDRCAVIHGRTCLRSGTCQGASAPPTQPTEVYWQRHVPWRYPPGQEYRTRRTYSPVRAEAAAIAEFPGLRTLISRDDEVHV